MKIRRTRRRWWRIRDRSCEQRVCSNTFGRRISPRGGFSGTEGASCGDARVQHVNDWHNNGNTPGIICTRSHFCGQTGFSTRGEPPSPTTRWPVVFQVDCRLYPVTADIIYRLSRRRIEHCPQHGSRDHRVLCLLWARRQRMYLTFPVWAPSHDSDNGSCHQFQCKNDTAFA